MMKQFLADMSAVIRTRLGSAEGGAKNALEAALRAAERMGSVEDADPVDFVACLRKAADASIDLGWAARDVVLEDWGGVSMGFVVASEVAGVTAKHDTLFEAADEFGELAKIAERDIDTPQIASIDPRLIEGIGVFRRSGEIGALVDCLTEAAFGEALTEPDMPEHADEAFLAAVRRECSGRVPDIAGHVRTRLPKATDGVVAVGLVYGELSHSAIASIAAAKAAA